MAALIDGWPRLNGVEKVSGNRTGVWDQNGRRIGYGGESRHWARNKCKTEGKACER